MTRATVTKRRDKKPGLQTSSSVLLPSDHLARLVFRYKSSVLGSFDSRMQGERDQSRGELLGRLASKDLETSSGEGTEELVGNQS